MQNQISRFQNVHFKLLIVVLFTSILLGQVRPAMAAPNLVAITFTGQPVAVSWNNPKKTHVFAVKTDHSVWQRTLDGTTLTWSAWQSLGAPIPGGVSSYINVNVNAISWTTGRVDLFVSSISNGVYHKFLINTTWSAWEYLGNPVSSSSNLSRGLLVTSWGAGRLDLFDALGAEFHKWYDASTGWHPSQTDWSSENPYYGYSEFEPTAAVSRTLNSIDLISVGDSAYIYHRWWDGSQWQPVKYGWESLDGQAGATPLALSWAYNRLDIFVRGYPYTSTAPTPVYIRSWNNTAGWTGWTNIGGYSKAPVTGVAWGANRLDVFEVRRDGASGVYHKAWTGTAWAPPSGTDWEYIGGQAELSDIAVTSWGPNRLDLFAIRSYDGSMWHLAWDGSGWKPSINLWELVGQ